MGGAEGVHCVSRYGWPISSSGIVRLMGVVVPVGFAQVNMQFFLAGDAEAMVVTVGVDSGAEEDPSVLADAVFSRLVQSGTIFEPSSHTEDWTMGPFVASIMTSTGPQIGTGEFSNQGEIPTQTTLPQNCAILVQKRTARGGRKGRGRMYWPPVYPNEATTGPTGLLDAGAHTAWQTAMTEFHALSVAESQPLVLLHSEAAGAIAPDNITSLVAQQRIATQRTRLRP